METRREWLAAVGAGLTMPAALRDRARPPGQAPRTDQGEVRRPERLALEDFQPKSALHVPEHRVERARFPVIDFHTHLTWSGRTADGRQDPEAVRAIAPPAELLSVMDRKSVARMVNLTGGR